MLCFSHWAVPPEVNLHHKYKYTGVYWVLEVLQVLCKRGNMYTFCMLIFLVYFISIILTSSFLLSCWKNNTATVSWLLANVISLYCVTMAMWAGWAHNAMCGLCPTRIGHLPGVCQSDYKVPVCIRTWKMTSNEGCSWTRRLASSPVWDSCCFISGSIWRPDRI